MHPIEVTKIEGFQVVRDDMIFGGTKRAALEEWLPTLGEANFIYAGSVFGWGAPALAAACKTLGAECTIMMSKSKYIPSWLERFEHQPVRLIMTEPTPVEFMAREIAAYGECYPLPPGFAAQGFIDAVAARAATMPAPQRAWVPVVSGTLLRALEQAWPTTEFHGVCAARKHGYEGSATLHLAPEKFSQPAENPPPYPACPFSDAKVWQFVSELGKPDDLIWNTNPE